MAFCNACLSSLLKSESSRANEAIYLYGSREDLRSRSACSFCRLVNRLIPHDLPPSTQIRARPRRQHPQDRQLEIYAGTQLQMSVKIVHQGPDKPGLKIGRYVRRWNLLRSVCISSAAKTATTILASKIIGCTTRQ